MPDAAPQLPPTESAAVAPTTPPGETSEARLAKAESELHRLQDLTTKKERQYAIEKQEFSKQKQAVNAQMQLLERAKKNPDGHLRSIYGESYRDWLKQYLETGAPPAEMALSAVEDRLSAFERKQEEWEKRRQAESIKAQADAHTQTIESFRADVAEKVKAQGEKYELINLYGKGVDVAARVESHFKSTSTLDEDGHVVKAGELLTWEKAADMVESELLDLTRKAVQAKKLKAVAEGQTKMEVAPEKKNEAKNISGLSGSTPAPEPAKTEAERRKRTFEAMDKAMSRPRPT